MERYQIKLIGKSPLLMHWDNIDFSEQVKKWQKDPANQKFSVKGDDRSPAFAWLGYLYHDGNDVAMPGANLMASLMAGGASVPVPGGKSGKTFKSQTQSGMALEDEYCKFLVDGKQIAHGPLAALRAEKDFSKHQSFAIENHFSLFVKRAKIGTQKHVRVRPRFDRWEMLGVLNVWDEQITKEVLTNILGAAGDYKGLGDWRPSSRTPGPYGRFSFEIKQLS